MGQDNAVTVTGNITRDPELRFIPSGAAVANFGLAVNRRWMNKATNEWDEQTSFFDVVCWREMAENVVASLTKGNRVVVTGRLEQRTWENDEQEKRSKVEIVADEVAPSLRWATAAIERNERITAGAIPANGAPTGQSNAERSAVMAGSMAGGGTDPHAGDPF